MAQFKTTHLPFSCFAVSKPYWSHEIGVLTAALLTIQVFGNAASCLLINNVNNCGPRSPWMLDYMALKMKTLRSLGTSVIVYELILRNITEDFSSLRSWYLFTANKNRYLDNNRIAAGLLLQFIKKTFLRVLLNIHNGFLSAVTKLRAGWPQFDSLHVQENFCFIRPDTRAYPASVFCGVN